MLRPERMSRVSITGSRGVLRDTVETIHDLDLVHLVDYDGGWPGFDNGDPMTGNERTAERLVTVRSLLSILDVDADDATRPRSLDGSEIADWLPDLRERVNGLDDRRDGIADDLGTVEDRLDASRPFVDLGVDIDLLRGYETLQVAVGEGDHGAVEAAVAGAYDRYEVIAGEGVVAAFVPAEAEPIDDVLVGVPFAALEVPEVEGETDPEAYVADLERERERLESELETVKAELEDVKHEAAGFLLAAEEALSIRVQKAEAPLQFATTEHAFVAEGWVPTADLERLRRGLDAAVGDRVDVDEVERADYDGHAPDEHGAADGVGAGAESPAAPAAADGGTGDGDEEIVADGGSAMAGSAGEPPVVQQNPAPVKPFEALVEVINRPKYDEFDPSVVLFLTFPAFFGFMIGDLGYGILYVLIGYLLYDRASGATLQSLGGIAMWAGGFTALFGVLYGEFFGLHQLGEIVWDGHPPIHKGLQPHFLPYAQAWLVLSLVAGIFHLTIGYTFDFVERLEHGVGEALLESGSWVVMMTAAWTWVLSLNATDIKPAFLVGAESVFNGTPFALGFTGFPMLSLFALPSWIPKAGGFDITVYLVVFVIGWGMLVKAELIGAIEFLNVVVNVLSYTRIAAVLLAKAGMAFVVNLLFFGAYQHDGEFHFLIDHGPEWVVGEYGAEALMFPGMFHGGIAALIGGLLVLVVGHLLVLALGITSAGLQAVRLEYVEFFGKFYEGGGERYEPFGRERRFTARE